MKVLNPFNLSGFVSMDTTKAKSIGLSEITTQDWFEGRTSNPHPKGLFSTEIFGPIGTDLRFEKWGYIDMKASILHPQLYKDICSMSKFYAKVIAGKALARYDSKTRTLLEDAGEDASTGYAFFMKHLPNLDMSFGESSIRADKVTLLEKHIKNNTHVSSAMLVVPAGMRELDLTSDHPSADEINDMYARIISIARSVEPHAYKIDPGIYDTQSMGILKSFLMIYEYIIKILSGKTGFMYSKLYGRNIQMGTRNVITAMPIHTENAEDNTLTNQHTTIGLYQYLQGTSARAIFEVKSKVMAGRVDDYDISSLVSNVKTMQAERVSLTQSQFDRYTSKEGLLSLFNYYEHRPNRWKTAMITDKHAVCLIYDDGEYIKLLSDKNELPEGFSAEHVSPITYTELLTYACYHSSHNTPVIPTRYPVATEGSTYLSWVYLIITHESKPRTVLDDQWQASEVVYERWPIKNTDFYDSMSIHPVKLDKAGADHDGDMTNSNFELSDEAVVEAGEIMISKAYHFKPGGEPIWSPDTKTTDFVMRTLTL